MIVSPVRRQIVSPLGEFPKLDFPFTLGSRLKGLWRYQEPHITQSGGLISAVEDESGRGFHGESSGLVRPTYSTALGVGAGEFGAGHYVVVPEEYAQEFGTDDWTTWCVGQTDDTTEAQAFYQVGGAAAGWASTVDGDGNEEWGVRAGGVGVVEDGPADANLRLVVASRISGTLRLYVSDGSDLVRVSLDSPSATINDPSGDTLHGGLTTTLWLLFGYLCEKGGATPALSGDAGIGNPCGGELLSLLTYAARRYPI